MILKFEDILKTKYGKEVIDSLPIEPTYREIEIRDFYIPMSDGTKHSCQGAFPVGADKLPIVFTRTPYKISSLKFFFEMAFYGYICIAENCRGCFDSEGEWVPAIHEKSDGKAALNYLKAQDYCNGSIALTGSSYRSMNEYLLCDELPPEVKTLIIENYSPYRHELIYTNGMFHLEAYSGWCAYNSGIKNLKCSQDEAYEKMINYTPQIDADENVLGEPLPWYRDWVRGIDESNSIYKEGPYAEIKDMPSLIDIPVLFHAGYYDSHFPGMIKSWNNLKEETRAKSHMVITPTNHIRNLCSDTEYPNAFEPVGPLFVLSQLNWLNYHLKGEGCIIHVNKGYVNAFVYGENKYQLFKGKIRSKMSRTRFADTNKQILTKQIPYDCPLSYVYDPLTHSKTEGSEVIMTDYTYHKGKKTTEGRRILSDEKREDTLTFVSLPFDEDVMVTGEMKLYLTVSSTAQDTCFFAKVSTVDKDGNSHYLRSSIATLKYALKNKYVVGNKEEIVLDFSYIAIMLKAGEKVRLDITSSDFPAYNVHPNTLTPWYEETNPIKATQTIWGGRLEF